MDRITRLKIRARQSIGKRSERFCNGFVEREDQNGPYVATATVWTGKTGSGRAIVSEHKTLQEAVDALYAVYNEYPNGEEDANILIDDVGWDQWPDVR